MTYEVSRESGMSDFYYCKKHTDIKMSCHIHSHFEIVFVQRGKLEIEVSGKSYVLNKGEMVFIFPYEVHSYEVDCETETFVIACPPEYISEYRELFGGKIFENPCTNFTKVQSTIISDIMQNDFKGDLMKKALIYSAVSEFIENCPLIEKNHFDYDVYRKVIVYISEHYTENITMESVAKYVGVTASHLSRVLNSDGKPGFSEILNSLRIHAAKALLERENVSVSEVAYETGYGSIRNFNRVFRQYFGCNPSDVKSK